MKHNRLSIALCSTLSICATVSAEPNAFEHPGWWKGRVFYEVFVRSFADSTKGPLADDGVGDIRGLIDRLDYLNDADPDTDTDLGVTGIWLMPIKQSPSYHGYDVVDYRSIDDEYGTNEDFNELVRECERRGIGVVIDMVINHTSSDHEWFRDSRDPNSTKRAWYVWADEHPGYRGAWGQNCWHRARRDKPETYLGLFSRRMPDLNYDNPEVTQAAYDIAEFWYQQMGAHGFRLDAIKHLIEEGQEQSNTDSTLGWLADYNTHLKEIHPGSFTLGEVWDGTEQVAKYIPDSLDSAFEFSLAYAIVGAAKGEQDSAGRLARTIDQVARSYPDNTVSTFITNHDKARVMSQIGGPDEDGFARAKMAATILLTLPGVPFIYYGEEIGMTGPKPDPQIRTPMQWDPDPDTGGFTAATPWKPLNNDITRGVSVEAQRDNPDSLFNTYRRLIHLRNRTDALREGGIEQITADGPVVAYTRTAGNQRVRVLINTGDEPRDTDISPSKDLLSGEHVQGTITLGPWGSRILQAAE